MSPKKRSGTDGDKDGSPNKQPRTGPAGGQSTASANGGSQMDLDDAVSSVSNTTWVSNMSSIPADRSVPNWLQPYVSSAEHSAAAEKMISSRVVASGGGSSRMGLLHSSHDIVLRQPGLPMTHAPALSETYSANIVPRISGLVDLSKDHGTSKLALGVHGTSTSYAYSFYDTNEAVQADGHRRYSNIPGYCKSPPSRETFDISKALRTGETVVATLLKLTYTHHRLSDFDQWKHPQRYVDFFAMQSGWKSFFDSPFALPLPAISANWRGDSVWASQFIEGPNPTLIRLVTSVQQAGNDIGARAGPLPADFPPIDQAFRSKVEQLTGMELEALIDQKRLFVVDHNMLKGCPVRDGRVLYAPISLFHVDHSQTLQPLCIFLRPGNTNSISSDPNAARLDDKTIYYPDSGMKWQLAKLLVGQADANHHEAVVHLGLCHLLMEAIILAVHLSFPADHKLYMFLAPHLHRTLWINDVARSTLISQSSSAPFSLNDMTTVGVDGALWLLDSAFKNLDFLQDCNLMNSLAKRGVLEPGVLPKGFYYRDFGVQVWKCLSDYVTEVVNEIYKTDGDVVRDSGLQAFVKMAGSPTGGRVNKFPAAVGTKAEAIDIITTMIWTGSAQHAAVNFPQYDYYAFAPAKPFIMTRPMPKAADVTWEYVTQALSGKTQTLETIVLMKTLSQQSAQDIHFETEADHPPLAFFKLDKVAYPRQYQQFVRQLTVAESDMRRINDDNGTNYHYLYPSEIPASVSI